MTTPSKKSFNHGGHDKGKYKQFKAELKRVREYLTTNMATATMVSVALNIYRPSLCRHKETLQRQGVLIELQKGKCRITGFEASYLSCNPEHLKGGVNDRK